MKKTIKLLSFLAIAAITVSSCKKDSAESGAPLALNNTKAATVGTVYTGAFTTPVSDFPGSAGNWGTTYFDLENNTTVTASAAHQAVFNGAWDGVINAGADYKLAYKDIAAPNSITLDNFKLQDADGATNVNSLGYNTPGPGWYIYDLATHTNAKVPNRYVIIYEGNSIGDGDVYAAQLITIGTSLDGTSGKYFGNVSFKFKKLN